jgi:hypothetical protein
MRRRATHWARAAFFLALGIVLVLAFAPAEHTLAAPVSDKLQHFFAFLVLTELALLGWANRMREVVLSLLVLAAAIEAVQGAEIIARDSELLDVAAGSAGVLSGVLLLMLCRKLMARTHVRDAV